MNVYEWVIGRSAMEKLEELKKWIDDQPAYAPVYSKSTPQAQMGMLVTALDEIGTTPACVPAFFFFS